jgi:1-phosphatidylinositol phosphodiesterase
MANTTWSTNWMSAIDDNARLSEISIPGTHDSCARFNSAPRTQTQWFSITQLLNRGIRFLDIRCRYVADGESGRTQNIYFPIHHGSVFQNIFFEEVQAQCIAFLNENPSETIIMNVQMEYTGNGDEFRTKFLQLTGPYQNHWYFQSSIPTLGACRGKIVLVRAGDASANQGWGKGTDGQFAGGLEWNGFYIDGESSNGTFSTQNGWNKWSGTEKGQEVIKYIKSAATETAHITLNFASYASDSGPGPNAAGMNPMLQNFLQTYNPQSWAINLGVIPIDFVGNTGDSGKSLENLIIERQTKQKPGSSYGGIAPWLLTESK